VADVPGGPAHGDLPRFHIQPPSFHSNAAGTGGIGAAEGVSRLGVAENSQSTGVDSLRRMSFLAISDRYSSGSVGSFGRRRTLDTTEF